MMNARVLELLKNPKNIQSEDLPLLKEEINSFPYLQNIRALHLIGVHLYEPENYQKELSTTAAYTTDKKILYQLINGKIEAQKPVEEVEKQEDLPEIAEVETEIEQVSQVENLTEKTEEKSDKHDYEAAAEGLIPAKPEIKHVFVEGERNRILFPGEENFLEEEHHATIDLESTLESGVIVTQKMPKAIVEEQIQMENSEKKATEDARHLEETSADKTEVGDNVSEKPEEIIPEKTIESKIDSEKNLSDKERNRILFKGEEDFLKEENQVVIDRESTLESGIIVTQNTPQRVVEENIQLEKSDKNSEAQGNILSEKSTEDLPTRDEKEKVDDSQNIAEQDLSAENKDGNSDFQETVPVNVETIIHKEKIDSAPEEEKILDESEVSFHATSTFLPDVQLQPNKEEIPQAEPQKAVSNKHEEEMRRLIAQVEARMKAKKTEQPQEKIEEEENHDHSQTSFAETQDFEVKNASSISPEHGKQENLSEKSEETEAEKETSEEANDSEIVEENSGWKPMSLETSLPDSLLNKTQETAPKEKIAEPEVAEEKHADQKEIQENKEEIEEYSEQIVEESQIIEEEKTAEDEQPNVMNMSFFGSDISKFETKIPAEKTEEKEEIRTPNTEVKHDASNVPGFINTWQSWLKIDRSEEIEKQKAVQKTKAIESFIENNPKISQLKDEVSFVVKEKNDDISHLMTETLANLYIEQKLYTKAVKSFQILAEKHPDRKSYFEDKIQEIKDLRNRN